MKNNNGHSHRNSNKNSNSKTTQDPAKNTRLANAADHKAASPIRPITMFTDPKDVAAKKAIPVASAPTSATKSSRTSAPSSTPGESRTLQVMTRSGVYREVTIRQKTTFELVMVDIGSKDAKEILCENEATAQTMGDKYKKNGSRVQRGERSFGL